MNPITRFIRHIALWLAVGLLTACQTMGVPAPQSFGERAAAAYTAVSAARDTALILARGNAITLADAENVQQQADNLRAGIDIARTMRGLSPESAEARLTQVSAALIALDSYLKSRKP